MTTGTMGKPPCTAIWKAPFLKVFKVGSAAFVLVPRQHFSVSMRTDSSLVLLTFRKDPYGHALRLHEIDGTCKGAQGVFAIIAVDEDRIA